VLARMCKPTRTPGLMWTWGRSQACIDVKLQLFHLGNQVLGEGVVFSIAALILFAENRYTNNKCARAPHGPGK
jgi:hypothetical protein